MADVKFDGASFNTQWISSFSSVSDFISTCPKGIFAGENREAKLTELYTIVNGKPKTTKKADKVIVVDELDGEWLIGRLSN